MQIEAARELIKLVEDYRKRNLDKKIEKHLLK